MKLTGKIVDVSVGFLDGKPKLTLEVNEKNDLKMCYDELHGVEKLTIEIKKYRKKRSLDANSYMWVLCGKLAEKIGSTKESVYRQHILNMGVYKVAEISEDAAETLIIGWQMNGIGWLAERVDYGAHDGFVLVNLYYGMYKLRTYNTSERKNIF